MIRLLIYLQIMFHYTVNSMLKIILTGKSLIQLNFKVNIHITYNALTLILFIVLRMLIIYDLSVHSTVAL